MVGYEGVYEVSDHGRVARTLAGQGARPGVRKQSAHPNGYMQVVLSKNNRQSTKKVHRLVLEAFRGPCPPGMETLHRDDVKSNNHLSNLRWGTHSDNHLDITRNGNRRPRAVTNACRRNHEKTEENGYMNAEGHWVCRPCRRARTRVHGGKI